MQHGTGEANILDINLSDYSVTAICPMRPISGTDIPIGLAWEKLSS